VTRNASRLGLVCAFAAALFACVGQGTGALSGELHVIACRDRTDFNRPSATDPRPYDMHPQFFVGEPIEDLNQGGFPHNRLEIRVQADSGNIGNVSISMDEGAGIDTLFISIPDVRQVAMLIGTPIAMQPLAASLPTTDATPVRASLQLLGTCPFSPSNDLLAANDAQASATITFSRFGSASACGTPPCAPPPADFKVDYGENLEATFDLNLVDERFRLGLSSERNAWGHVMGRFSFELRRGAAGQTFP
jgi:hypothetical protein